jgi:hypothetical protein
VCVCVCARACVRACVCVCVGGGDVYGSTASIASLLYILVMRHDSFTSPNIDDVTQNNEQLL